MIPTIESVTTLAQRWAAGDRRAGSELVTKHDDWIRQCARRAAMVWEDEDDVAQIMRLAFVNVAVKVAAGSVSMDDTARFIRKAMRNAFWDTRKKKRPCEVDEECIDESVSAPCDATLAKYELNMIARASNLDAETGDLLINRFGHELNGVEHGHGLGISQRSVARRAISAMNLVRSVIGVAEVYVRPGQSAKRNERRVVEYLQEKGPSFGKDICVALQLGRSCFWLATSRLREVGTIVVSGENRYKQYMLSGSALAEAA